MKKRFALVAASAFAFSAFTAAPVFAHDDGPCNDSGEPGNSDYAQHHIVPLAQEGGMGNDGHKPGSHQGYSICLGD